MARIVAEKCARGCKMKRLYTRAEGGRGWDSGGWFCTCGCGSVTLDEGEWQLMECCTPQDG